MARTKKGRKQAFYMPDAINDALKQAYTAAVERNPATGSLSHFTSQLIWEALENRSNQGKNYGN